MEENQEPVLYAPLTGQLCSGCGNEIPYTPIAAEVFESAGGDCVVLFDCDLCGKRGEILVQRHEKS